MAYRFGYKYSDDYTLKLKVTQDTPVEFTIPLNTKCTVLLGMSGAGKSLLVSLIEEFQVTDALNSEHHKFDITLPKDCKGILTLQEVDDYTLQNMQFLDNYLYVTDEDNKVLEYTDTWTEKIKNTKALFLIVCRELPTWMTDNPDLVSSLSMWEKEPNKFTAEQTSKQTSKQTSNETSGGDSNVIHCIRY